MTQILVTNPIAFDSISLSSNLISAGQTSVATVNVTDSRGIYDVATNTMTGTTIGVQAINHAMIPSVSNIPGGGSGIYTYTLNPDATIYSQYTGIWSTNSKVTDDSGNSYSSQVVQLYIYTQGSWLPRVSWSASWRN